ncbi:MAG: IS200/IS605 family transposase, partial [Dehalococcoidia bacterium]
MELIHLSHCVYQWGADAVWSEGYFVSTVGVDEGVIQAYIENQRKK